MRQLGSLLKWAILLPILIVVVLLAVANDHQVPVRLNPFQPDDPVLQVQLALYQLAFLLFVLGALLGSLVTWLNQRRYRREARREREQAAFWASRAQQADRSAEQAREPSRAAAFLPRPARS